jgi:hypothetical protein
VVDCCNMRYAWSGGDDRCRRHHALSMQLKRPKLEIPLSFDAFNFDMADP